jgi:hypothetical protein
MRLRRQAAAKLKVRWRGREGAVSRRVRIPAPPAVPQNRRPHVGKALRRETRHDRLTTNGVFRRLHTTLGNIERMVKRCRVPPRVPVATARPTAAKSSGTPAASNAAGSPPPDGCLDARQR